MISNHLNCLMGSVLYFPTLQKKVLKLRAGEWLSWRYSSHCSRVSCRTCWLPPLGGSSIIACSHDLLSWAPEVSDSSHPIKPGPKLSRGGWWEWVRRFRSLAGPKSTTHSPHILGDWGRWARNHSKSRASALREVCFVALSKINHLALSEVF